MNNRPYNISGVMMIKLIKIKIIDDNISVLHKEIMYNIIVI